MSALSLASPFPIFTDIDGDPLDSGYVYVGTAGLNPETNPIQVYWDPALSIPTVQPIRTLNGYPSRNGTPAVIYANADDCSILVKNKNGSLIFSAFNQQVRISSALVVFVQSGAGAVATTVQDKLHEFVSVKDFGAVGDGVTDDTAAFTAAAATGQPYYVPYTSTFYNITSKPSGSMYGPGVVRVSGSPFRIPGALVNTNSVTMVNTDTNSWIVLKPNGEPLNISGTVTSGLQEAIDYAVDNGHNLKVYGGGTSTVDYGLLYTTDTVVFPPMRCMTVEFEGVHIESTPTTPGNQAMTINSCMMVDFKFNGEIVYNGTGNALEFHPTIGPGVDPLINIVDSRFYITTVVTLGSAQSCVTYNIVDGSITNSFYQFSEINANDNGSGTATTTYGIGIIGNDVSGNHFELNTVICPHVHGGLVNVAIGNSPTNAENIAYNTFDVDCSTSVNGATGIVCLGKGNTGRVSSTVSTPGSIGFAYSGNAVRNCFIYKNEGSYSNGCSDKTANQLIVGAPLVHQALTVSGSPFAIQNTDLSNWYITVQGGTGVNIYTGFDGVTYYDMGFANGQVTLQQGMYLRVVYSTAPTIRKFAYTY